MSRLNSTGLKGWLFNIGLLSLTVLSTAAFATGKQYTAADYRKELDFFYSIRDKAYNVNLDFHWQADDAGLWFESKSEKASQFLQVNTQTGELSKLQQAPQVEQEQTNQPPRRQRPDGGGFQRPNWGSSPDGKWRAYSKENQLWLEEIASGQQKQLTNDGVSARSYSNQIFFSPDSSKLICILVKPVEERKVHYIESSPADQLQPKHFTQDYAKPGDDITTYYPTLFDVASGSQIPVSDELFTNQYNLDDYHWCPDSSEFLFYYNQRGHQINRVLAINAQTGAVRTVVEEKSDTFIDYSGKKYLRYLDDTNELIWASERDGWNHLYLYDLKTGQVKNQITSGNWVMRKVQRVDAAARHIYFTASGYYPGQDPYFIHYFRVNFDGSGPVAYTSANGTHELTWSPTGKFYIDKWSRINQPPIFELHRSDATLVCKLAEADVSAQFKAGWQAPEPFMAMSRDDKYEIWGVIYRPVDFDPSQKYPVIEDIYAGPHDSFVPKNWRGYDYWRQALAELGFIVVQIDGMGTSNRCREFHHFAWKNIADAGLPDRIKWIKAAAAKYPYMDIDHVGIYGTSAGGQSAMGALLFHGDFYKAAVASCGCHDNRMDKIWWNEQWMGYPVDDSYAANSNVVNAAKLQGKLLLIVGELDRNVDPASTMQVANALIKANKDFDLLVVPGMDHSDGGKYGERKRRDFFIRNLRGDIPVDWNTVPKEQILP